MTEKDYEKLKQIEEAIQSFNSKNLYDSSLALYKALDYQSNKTNRLSLATFDGLLDAFSISKNAINNEKALTGHWKQVEFIFQVADSEITRVQSLFDTGEVDRNEYQSFLFFTIHLKEETYKRGELVKITRELNLPFKMPVIVLFHYGNKLTLSIIDRRLNKTDSSKDVLEKVTLIKDIDIVNPQRAHKEILKDLSLKELYKKFEFHSFVKLHEAWKATLNISELNKKFFNELANWYFWATTQVAFPDDEIKDKEIRNATGVIRLITRLMFVWFLKEKNLVPEDLFDEKKLKALLNYKDKNKSTYYKAILQNLFFATLNTEMGKRKFRSAADKSQSSHYFIHNLFRYEKEFIKPKETLEKYFDPIPFLNGGLFECLDKQIEKNGKLKAIRIDGFSDREDNALKVPDELFFSEKEKTVDLSKVYGTPKKSKEKVRGLIDILNSYKFTIAENTPIEEEVALDPELLGKVFENLLANYNPETQTTARKQTGSFYTPREIVNYMVDESLLAYLKSALSIPAKEVSTLAIPGQGVDQKQDAFETFFNPNNEIEIHQGNLPHWQQENVWYFITFRLADSIPAQVAEQIKSERELWLKKHKSKIPGNNTDTSKNRSRDASETYSKNRNRDASGTYTKEELKEYYRLFSERVETLLNAGKGSCVLKDKANAEIVANAMLHFNHQRYELDDWVIMPNHVHVLVKPVGENKLPDILHSWKSFTANKINEKIGTKGQLWMHESYDHIVRNERALVAIRNYIRQNPVKAGLSAGSFLASDDSAESFLASDESTGSLSASGENRSLSASGENRSRDASDTMRLRNLLSYSEEKIQFSDAEKEQLINAIDKIKILDPACGSGAFPMGILHKLVHILHKLDPKNELWKQRQIEKASAIDDLPSREAAIETIEEAFENNELDYGRKLYLIENCIYGVDIQPIAVQISKLRFFISLIVEQKVSPASSGRDNLGIRPLPNLETKFVAANTLIALEKEDLFSNEELKQKKEKLKSVRHKYFEARTPKTKQKCRYDDERLRGEMTQIIKGELIHFNQSIAQQIQQEERLVEMMKKELHKPNLRAEQKVRLEKDLKKKAGKIAELKLHITDNNAIEQTAHKLASWNPYDQNASASFFDTEWMFGLKDGFDVVIGNPPYKILTKNNTLAAELKYFLERYKSIQGSYSKNLFTLFVEKSFSILSKNATLSFIVPEGLFKTRSYSGCVEEINKNGSVQAIVTFSDFVFENAVTGNLIFIFSKNKKSETKKYHFTADYDLKVTIENNDSLLKKIEIDSVPLSQVATTFKGMVVKDREEVVSENLKGKKNIFLLGRSISKWKIDSELYTNFNELEIIGGTKRIEKHNQIPRILIRRTGDTLCCSFLTEKALTESTLYSSWSISNRISTKTILGLLNSKILDYYNKKLFITNQQGFPQILMSDFELLPIKIPSNNFQINFDRIVDYILLLKKQNKDSSFFERLIDTMVYELYLPETIQNAKCEVLKHLNNLPDLQEGKDENLPADKAGNLKTIEKVYAALSDPKHPVSVALQSMQEIEEVKIIEGKK